MKRLSLSVEVDRPRSLGWSDLTQRFEDASIYQTEAYGTVRWGASNLSHLVMRRDSAVVAAAQLRIMRPPLLPLGIAYLRWGPLCQPVGEAMDPEIVIRIFSALREEYAVKRGLLLQVVPNAWAGTRRGAMFEEAFSLNDFTIDRTRQPYHTIIVDLVRPLDVIRKQLDQKWRNQLNQSEKHNLQITTDGSADSFSAFLGLYDEMKGNKGFETSVNEREFERMQDQLPSSQKMQVFLARENGLAIGGLVCSRLGDTVIYLLGATIGRARELKAAYLLHWCAIKWFREQGALCYDLGGVDLKTNPGGHHFKSGFKGNEMTHLPPHACSPGVVGTVIQSVSGFLRNGFRGRG